MVTGNVAILSHSDSVDTLWSSWVVPITCFDALRNCKKRAKICNGFVFNMQWEQNTWYTWLLWWVSESGRFLWISAEDLWNFSLCPLRFCGGVLFLFFISLRTSWVYNSHSQLRVKKNQIICSKFITCFCRPDSFLENLDSDVLSESK